MKRINTVKSHREFDEIIHHGVKLRSSHYAFFYQLSPLDYSRIGLAVGKANGGAVKRVRIKRQVRAMLAKKYDFSLPVSIIVVIRPDYDPDQFEKNETELCDLLNQMKEKLH